MVNSFKACLATLHKRVKAIFQHMIHVDRICHSERNTRSQKTNTRLSSNFDALIPSSFEAMELTNQFKQVFKLIDANGDGKISSRELSEVLLCLAYEESTNASCEAEGMIREMDSDGDGVVDLDEFIGAMDYDQEFDELMDAFSIFDADKNGLISARELQRVLTNLGCKNCSLRDCKRMIKGVDKDGDGFVDFDEFRSMMVQSSAT